MINKILKQLNEAIIDNPTIRSLKHKKSKILKNAKLQAVILNESEATCITQLDAASKAAIEAVDKQIEETTEYIINIYKKRYPYVQF